MIRIVNKKCITRVYQDDVELQRVTKLQFSHSVEEIPVLKLELLATEFEIETDSAITVINGLLNLDKLKSLIAYGESQWDGQPINKGMLEGLKEALRIMEGEA